MKTKAMLLVVLICLLLISSGDVFAADMASITDNLTTFKLTTDPIPLASFLFNGKNHLYRYWWFYRVTGDTEEYPFPHPDSTNTPGADEVELVWNNVDSKGFSADLAITIVETTEADGDDTGIVGQTLTITNNSGAPMEIDIFLYADTSLGSDQGSDSATLLKANDSIEVTDATFGTPYRAWIVADFDGTSAYKAGHYTAVYTNLLLDSNVDDLDNTGLPFVPGADDFACAIQDMDRTLANGADHDYVATLSVTNDQTTSAVTLSSLTAAASGSGVLALPVLLLVALLTLFFFSRIKRNHPPGPAK